MPEIILNTTANGVYKSADGAVTADTTSQDAGLILTTPKGVHSLRWIRKSVFPCYSTFYKGRVSNTLLHAQIEILKSIAILTW